MKFDSDSRDDNTTNTDVAAGDGADTSDGAYQEAVQLKFVNLDDLDYKSLFNLMFEIIAARNILDGYMTEVLNRYGDLVGENELGAICRQFGMGRYFANRQARTARALRELPTTLDEVKAGEFSIDHARLLGESNGRVPLSRAQENELINKAKTEDLDKFRKTVARQEDDRRSTDGESQVEQQRHRRKASVFNGDDGMVVLHAELDRVSGERVKTALDGMCDRMFRDDSENGIDRSPQQRAADALVALITQTPGKKTGDCNGGSRRDKHCVNCGLRATACDVHHIRPWEYGGKTNIDNLVLLCPTCHAETHKHKPRPPTQRFKQPIYSNVLLTSPRQ